MLRQGLSVITAGHESALRYIIRDSVSGKQKILADQEFFILAQLSHCETLEQLKEAFMKRFDTELSQEKVEQTLNAIGAANLWGRSASEHPLVAPLLSNREEATDGRRRRRAAMRSHQRPRQRRGASAPRGRNSQAEKPENSAADAPAESLPEENAAAPEWQPAENAGKVQVLGDIVPTALPDEEPARERAMAGRQRVGNGNGGGAAGGGQARVPGMRQKSIFPQWKLFKTDGLLALLSFLLPLRSLLLWSIPLLLIVSGFIISNHTENFISEFDRIVGDLSFIARVGLSLVTINLVSTVARGLAAYHFGMRTFDFGVRLIMWFLPRFILGALIDQKAPRSQQAWVAAMPLLAKLFLFGVGIVFWFLLRATDNSLSHFFILLAAMAAGSFVLTAFPLFPASGYQLLTIWTNEPMLRQKALGALKSGLTTGRLPEGSGYLLMIYGFLSLLFLTLLVGFVFYLMGSISQAYFQTTGIIFSAMFSVFILYKLFSRTKQGDQQKGAAGRQQGARRGGGAQGGGAGQMQRRQAGGRGGVAKKAPTEPQSPGRRLLKYGVLAALVGVMFLPYSYETGGELIMVPLEHQDITTDVSGIIEKIYYEGGESLAKGALIAQLNVGDAKRQINIHDARIKEQQAVIDSLLAKPTPEELNVALSALKVQQTKADYSAKDVARKELIFKKNVISEDEVEKARREHEVDLGNVIEAEANVALVRSGATTEELLAAEAELARWVEERNLYKDIYEKSFLYMPITGKLTTQFLKQKLGQYLNKGEVFAEAENTSSLLAEIEVPEFDSGLIRLGAAVRVRAWSYHEELFEGVVTKVDTNVEQRSFGNVVKVVTRLENSDGRLKAGMTGYAKISGETRPVWEVLFLTIVRFVEVEMWSWIP